MATPDLMAPQNSPLSPRVTQAVADECPWEAPEGAGDARGSCCCCCCCWEGPWPRFTTSPCSEEQPVLPLTQLGWKNTRQVSRAPGRAGSRDAPSTGTGGGPPAASLPPAARHPKAKVSGKHNHVCYLTKLTTAFVCEGRMSLSVTHVINYFLTISSFPAS